MTSLLASVVLLAHETPATVNRDRSCSEVSVLRRVAGAEDAVAQVAGGRRVDPVDGDGLDVGRDRVGRVGGRERHRGEGHEDGGDGQDSEGGRQKAHSYVRGSRGE